MAANGGLGEVVAGSQIDLSDGKSAEWTEKVTAVRQDDCGDYWVISLVDNDNSTNGELFIMGNRIDANSSDDFLSKLRLEHIGFVFQTFNLLAYM